MDITKTVLFIFPAAVPIADFVVAQPWNAPASITKWNASKLGPQPTMPQLEAVWPKAQLQAAQTIQKAQIKQSFLSAANAPVTDSNGITWEGGMASGNSIFLGCQLAQQAGAASITLYDAAKAPHTMTIAEGMRVASLIGAAYQAALGKKNSLYAQIEAATTVAEVQAILWP